MKKTNGRALYCFTLKSSGIDDNRWGWLDDETNSWVIQPTLTYSQAMCFNFTKYHNSIEKYRQRLIKDMLKEKVYKAKVRKVDFEEIQYLKEFFEVKHIKDACSNFNHEHCETAKDIDCINCKFRNTNYESFEERSNNG
ncbi:MAG: hypothetical protein PHE28_03305 [Bacteroidales bacterium]|nr:hypothetical protein [Bacteroidales bacterium]